MFRTAGIQASIETATLEKKTGNQPVCKDLFLICFYVDTTLTPLPVSFNRDFLLLHLVGLRQMDFKQAVVEYGFYALLVHFNR